MSLIRFHQLLIASAIVFCHGFAIWEFVAFAREGGTGRILIGVGFAVAGLALTYYLIHLRRMLNLPDAGPDSPAAPDERA